MSAIEEPACLGNFNRYKRCKGCPFGLACRDKWLRHKYVIKGIKTFE